MSPVWAAVFASWLLPQSVAAPPPQTSTLDYAVFRDRVQPILLAKRPGHARCTACHMGDTPMRLQPLSPGQTTWDEEQSRKNFDAVARMVVPGNPLRSRLLLHPLAGGDSFHIGGPQWMSADDPEWKILADWVRHTTNAPAK